MLWDFLNFWSWQRQKRSNSARHPQFSKLARSSKTKQFCETSFKNGTLSAELTASYQCVLRFFHSTCLKYCACHGSYEVLHLSRKISSSQNWRSDAPKCNPSQEISALISHIYLMCLLYCACHAKCIFADPLQMSHACHRFWKCCKTFAFCSLLRRCNPLRLPRESTSEHPKVLRTRQCFALLTSKCASRHNACTYSTSELPKVFWTWCALHILTWKCASRHNGVHFFNISTSKSAPNVKCF